MKIEYSPLVGYTNNLYGAPSEKPLTGPDSLFADTLNVSDIWLQNAVRFNFDFKDEKHAVLWKNRLTMRSYFDNPAANTTAFSSALRYLYKSKNEALFGSNVSIGKSDQLYLDLITTDLLHPFDRNFLITEFYVGKECDNQTLIGKFKFKRDRFEPCLTCEFEEIIPSLSSNQWGVAVEDTLFLGPSNRQQKFVISAGWRNQRFVDWMNTNLVNPQFGEPAETQFLPFSTSENYTTQHWRYVDAHIAYFFPLDEKSVITPYLTYQNRFDVGNSDFDRQDVEAGMRLNWEHNKVKIVANGSFVNQRFGERLAANVENEGGELLRYTMLNADLRLNYLIAKRFSFSVGGNYQKRTSNRTNELSVRRKSYERWVVYGGIEFILNTTRSGK